MQEKLQKVLDCGYLDNDEWIVSLTSYFDVPKGEDDIRMVYDGTKCGLNDAVWIPSFFLPSVQTHLRAVEEGTYICDVDVGEMFLNFMAHPSLRKNLKVDLFPYSNLDLSVMSSPLVASALRKVWVSWNRIAMGLTWSPYQAVKSLHLAEEIQVGVRGQIHPQVFAERGMRHEVEEHLTHINITHVGSFFNRPQMGLHRRQKERWDPNRIV